MTEDGPFGLLTYPHHLELIGMKEQRSSKLCLSETDKANCCVKNEVLTDGRLLQGYGSEDQIVATVSSLIVM